MPIATNPKKRWRYKFDDGSNASIEFRHCTADESGEIVSLVGEAEASDDYAAQIKKYVDAISIVMTGWSNMPSPSGGKCMKYAPSKLGSVLSLVELGYVLTAIVERIKLGDEDQKKSESPSPSSSAESADAAKTASA